jgi:hypothetical protein
MEVIFMRLHRPTLIATTMFFLTAWQPLLAMSPTIAVMPGPGKSLTQFQSDDAACRSFATSQSAQTAQAGQNSVNGTAARTTVGGAAAGALIGAGTGNAGRGAAIGAGAGLVGGAVRRDRRANQAAGATQQSFNIAYAQCMQTRGNTVPANAFSQ